MSTTDETIQGALLAFGELIRGDRIDAIDSEDLAEEAWNVSSLLSADPLPRGWRAIERCYTLYLEVQNGGLHQFFWNRDGEGGDETFEDLHYIGAQRFAEIFQRARAIYEGRDYPSRSKSTENSWEEFTEGYQITEMKQCDQQFYDEYNEKPLPHFIAEFIRLNRRLLEPENA